MTPSSDTSATSLFVEEYVTEDDAFIGSTIKFATARIGETFYYFINDVYQGSYQHKNYKNIDSYIKNFNNKRIILLIIIFFIIN